jgi:hypothetical protein
MKNAWKICSHVICVGDSPRGPLKHQGNPRLKHATKLNTPRLTMRDTAHAAEAPNGSPRRPARRSPRAGFASLEDVRLPQMGSVPFEGVHLPRAGSASLESPLPPRAGSASLEGPLPPRTGSASLEDAPHARACSRTLAFNALTPAGRRHHAPGARAPVRRANSPGGISSPPLWEALCGATGASPVTPRCLLRYS